jgi:uncharacterized protein YciI
LNEEIDVHYVLFYEKGDGYADRQKPLRAEHVDYVMNALNGDSLILAGSLANPVDGSAMLVFKSDSPDIAERFAKDDPYVVHGVVSRWYVRAWDTI